MKHEYRGEGEARVLVVTCRNGLLARKLRGFRIKWSNRPWRR